MSLKTKFTLLLSFLFLSISYAQSPEQRFQLADRLADQGHLDSSLVMAEELLEECKGLSCHDTIRMQAHFLSAILKYSIGKSNEALLHLKTVEAIGIEQKLDSHSSYIRAMSAFGIIYGRLRKKDLAEKYHIKATSISEKHNETNSEATVDAYQKYLAFCVNSNKLEEGRKMITKIGKVRSVPLSTKLEWFRAVAHFYMNDADWPLAAIYFSKLEELLNTNPISPDLQVGIKTSLGKFYLETQQPTLAYQYFKQVELQTSDLYSKESHKYLSALSDMFTICYDLELHDEMLQYFEALSNLKQKKTDDKLWNRKMNEAYINAASYLLYSRKKLDNEQLNLFFAFTNTEIPNKRKSSLYTALGVYNSHHENYIIADSLYRIAYRYDSKNKYLWHMLLNSSLLLNKDDLLSELNKKIGSYCRDVLIPKCYLVSIKNRKKPLKMIQYYYNLQNIYNIHGQKDSKWAKTLFITNTAFKSFWLPLKLSNNKNAFFKNNKSNKKIKENNASIVEIQRLGSFDTLKVKSLLLENENLQTKLNKSVIQNAEVKTVDIEHNLKKDEALLDFFLVEHTNSVHFYSVSVLNKNLADFYRTVQLKEEKPKYSILYNQYLSYCTDENFNYEPNPEIFNTFWGQIEPHLKGIKTIYYCPDGIFHKINFSTLRDKDGNFLIDKYNFILLDNAEELIEFKNKKARAQSAPSTAALFGFPTYLLASNEINELEKIDNSEIKRTFKDGKLEPLPETAIEVAKINKLLSIKGVKCNTFLEKNATESTIKKLASPGILHIATHADTDDTEKVLSSDLNAFINVSLFGSKIFLSGAQNSLNGQKLKSDDGILTAYEVQDMDLTNTELVVLSACNTGRGKIQNGEGVWGLQRAFRIAGASQILMSLWEVPSSVTAELMVSFYENWIQHGMSKHQALKAAQMQLRKTHPQPYYWGAWVLSGI